MSDDKTKKGARDRSRVAGGENWEVSYMTRKFNVTAKDVEKAVEAVDNDRKKVEEYLSNNRKGK